jgi:hypothetical protein
VTEFDIRDHVVLITSADAENRAFGTAFVIHREAQTSYLATCAHVVRDVGGPGKTIVADRAASVVAFGTDGFPDMSVLSVNDLSKTQPLRLQAQAEEGDAFLADGFQSFGKQNYLHRPVRGVLGAQIGLVDKGQSMQVRAWDLSIIGEYDLQPGYSGSPVVLEKTGAVLGVASHTVGQKKGVAISIDTLGKIWPAAPASLFGPAAAPVAAAKPSSFSEIRQKMLQRRITILIKQYEAAMDQYNSTLSAADRVTLDNQAKNLEQEIINVEKELALLII